MSKKIAKKAAAAEEMILAPRIEAAIPEKDLLSTGSTMLNLALSGRACGGVAKGMSVLFIGKPQSGKTWLSFTVLAEASISPQFKDYRLFFDNVENGALMEIKKYFGKKLWDKLEPPRGTREKPIHSTTVEEFYDHLDDAIKGDRPFVYVLDSMDALTPEKAKENFEAAKKARRGGKEVKGSYGMDKAKANSENLRGAVNRMKEKGSILIMICQTRDNFGYGAMYNPDKHGGGNALEFYSRLVVWTSPKGEIKKRIAKRDKEIVIGGSVQAKVTKNSITGWKGKVYFDFLRDSGIDDVGSMIDFLTEWKHWVVTDGKIAATELNLTLKKESLVRQIEQNDLEGKLKEVVTQVWDEIEEESRLHRKRKYG